MLPIDWLIAELLPFVNVAIIFVLPQALPGQLQECPTLVFLRRVGTRPGSFLRIIIFVWISATEYKHVCSIFNG